MTRKWQVEVRRAEQTSDALEIRLRLCDPATNVGIDAIPACSSMDSLKAELAALKDELDQLVVSAERKCRELTTNGNPLESSRISPEAIWKKMEGSASKEEMFEYFNSFDVTLRQETADHIFTHASMFKGWGPVFAEHYNLSTQLLEA